MTKTNSCGNLNSSCSLDTTMSEEFLAKSLDLSTHISSNIVENLKLEIECLKTNLSSTQNELDNIILENSGLKQQLTKLSQEISILKNLCKSPLSSLRKTTPSKRNRRNKRRLTDTFANSSMNSSVNSSPSLKKASKECSKTNNETKTKYTTTLIEDNSQKDKLGSRQEVTSDFCKNNIKKDLQYRRCFIFGGKQCSKLSEHMEKSRLNNPYEKYKFITFIKPHATTEEILLSAKLFDITPNDRIIISVGEHDKNPQSIIKNLYAFVKSYICPVFVIEIQRSMHLNEYKLNSMLKFICTQHNHTYFIDHGFVSDNVRLSLCKSINSGLDQIDYNVRFLGFNKNTKKYVHKGNFKTKASHYLLNNHTQSKTHLNGFMDSHKKPVLVDTFTQTEHTSSPTNTNDQEQTFFRDS